MPDSDEPPDRVQGDEGDRVEVIDQGQGLARTPERFPVKTRPDALQFSSALWNVINPVMRRIKANVKRTTRPRVGRWDSKPDSGPVMPDRADG